MERYPSRGAPLNPAVTGGVCSPEKTLSFRHSSIVLWLIAFSRYGSHLPGDARGSFDHARKGERVFQPPNARPAEDHRRHLRQSPEREAIAHGSSSLFMCERTMFTECSRRRLRRFACCTTGRLTQPRWTVSRGRTEEAPTELRRRRAWRALYGMWWKGKQTSEPRRLPAGLGGRTSGRTRRSAPLQVLKRSSISTW